MPMIDVYAAAGTFADKHKLAADLAAAVMTVEQVPDIPMFRQNTAAFIHDLPRRRRRPGAGQPDVGAAHRGPRRWLGPVRPREHQRGTGGGRPGADREPAGW